MHTHIHTLNYTYGQFHIPTSPIGIFEKSVRKPRGHQHRHKENPNFETHSDMGGTCDTLEMIIMIIIQAQYPTGDHNTARQAMLPNEPP